MTAEDSQHGDSIVRAPNSTSIPVSDLAVGAEMNTGDITSAPIEVQLGDFPRDADSCDQPSNDWASITAVETVEVIDTEPELAGVAVVSLEKEEPISADAAAVAAAGVAVVTALSEAVDAVEAEAEYEETFIEEGVTESVPEMVAETADADVSESEMVVTEEKSEVADSVSEAVSETVSEAVSETTTATVSEAEKAEVTAAAEDLVTAVDGCCWRGGRDCFVGGRGRRGG
ncbi:hypothetical protein JM18_005513 [Phytophthora kernoviae]|uniref:Uncharacterized protein n=1 Tax=Phytophthora kernoviae TaxID=325452 RepID=A0A921SE56_9STRA|nr:hypothetical protein JM18_005513 [Phytophthora kernoviae]